MVQEAQSSQQTSEVKKQRTRLATAKQRVSELEVLLCKIYEDNALGMISLLRYTSNNINQIAKRLNESGRIYDADIAEIKDRQAQLWELANGILTKLSKVG